MSRKLEMEYVLKPITNTSLEFLYRFKNPVETIWQDGAITQPMAFISPEITTEDRLKKFGMERFREMVANDGGFLAIVREGVELYECKIIRVDP